MERIGVFGGTFDPPHWGHIRLAETAYTQLKLDKVLWVPAGQPPHKQGDHLHRPTGAVLTSTGRFGQMTWDMPSPPHHRMAMTLLAISGNSHFELNLLDMHRPGPHFTVEMLTLLHQRYGTETMFWFLIGEDSLRELGNWRSPEQILQLCRLAVFPRPGPPTDWEALEQIVPGIHTQVDWLEAPPVELSSSVIRRLIRQGRPIDEFVPETVCNYIREQEVYTVNLGLENF